MNALFRLLILTSLSLLALAPPAGAAPVQRDHVEAELIAEHRTLQAGRSDNTVALRLKPEAGWHVYWRNPGDSGLPTRLEWRLPEGVQAGEIAWPYPHAQSLGDLTNYGYDAETLHLVPLSVDRGLAETTVTLEVTAKWLVCADVCIPGEADLQLTLPVIAEAPAPDARWTDAFRQARSQLPRRDEALKARFQVGEGEFRLAVEGLPAEATAARFFPYSGELIQHSAYARQMLEAPAGRLRIAVAQSPYLVDPPALVEGVLLLTLGSGEGVGSRQAQAYEIRAEPGEVAAVAGLDPPPVRAAESPAASAEAPPGWALVLGFAFLGGLILNLMPCVFPVLALKAYTVLQAREEERGAQRAHALAYTAGVLASFALIGGLLIALRAGGAALGWGFQLQSPVVVTALAWLMVMLGLSMSGAFELGTRWMGLGQGLAAQGGSRGAFFTGVLATVVASPCTAPFMGTALGFALTQPAALALLVFL
ncbi:MAG TPA: protein-disulfide reductase DsbD domain-containing protein, partial [Nevskiaceae bacterium]|nr:protein-disulfide reductase DsbD domain-containing protein [Nevskiaceae bacterium]